MKKILLLIIVLSISIIWINCEKDTTSPNNSLTPLSLEEAIEEAIKEVTIQLVNYDSVQITSKETFVLESKSIELISIERHIVYGPNSYTIEESFNPQYEGSSGAYKVVFDYAFKARGDCNLKLKYHLTNQDSIEVDTLMSMYKYPYTSTEIFFDLEYTTQGFEIVGDYIYFCPSGGLGGIWRDNLVVEEDAEDLYCTGSGDLIAADSLYVFHDAGHYSIIRYNIQTEQMDMEFDLSSLGDDHFVGGLAVYNGKLYAYICGNVNPASSMKLVSFDFGGNILEEIEMDDIAYGSMEIYNDICYWSNYSTNEILRYDLNTQTFLESVPAPSRNVEGIRIYGDYLYFTKFGYNVYRTLLTDLNL